MKKTIFTTEKFDKSKCKPNAFRICADLYHGIEPGKVSTRHHLPRQAVLLCQYALKYQYGMGAIQLALYRVVSRASSGKISKKRFVKILNDARLQLKDK